MIHLNKNIVPFKSTLLKNKLASVFQVLLKARDTTSISTREALIKEAIKMINSFYKQIDRPLFVPVEIFPGSKPNPDLYNQQLQSVLDDLIVLFTELENVENVILEQFNITATNTNKLKTNLKRLNSKIVDYSLYARLPLKTDSFFSDTFSDFSRVDKNSKLLNSKECEINQAEGIITLPVDRQRSKVIRISQRPIINSNSNGVPGNNEEVGALAVNDNLESILDGNPDTWFEYERVDLTDTRQPLVLDITLSLTTPDIVNFLRINPNNFGTKSQIQILNIDTSLDGKIFTSIKDDIPISGYLSLDEDNIFTLASSTSKFAGQGLYTFTPRKIKYIRLTLQQTSPYTIQTVRGRALRYAIGLRDIEVQQLVYEGKGELVSVPFLTNKEIAKVALDSTQNPVQNSELATITHQVSFDNGITWNNILPRQSQGVLNITNETPEILTLNLSVPGSIKTNITPQSVRYKAILERHDEAFNENSASFAEAIERTSEIKAAPRADPWTITLTSSPVVDTIRLIDPNFGSRGKETKRYLMGTGISGPLSLVVPSEFKMEEEKVLLGDSWKIGTTSLPTVFVGGEEWTLRPTIAPIDADPHFSDKYYTIKSTSDGHLKVVFGDGYTSAAPPQGAAIEFALPEERLLFTSDTERTATLMYPSSADKNSVRITRLGETITTSHQIGKDVNIHRLPVKNILIDDDHSFSTTDATVFNPAFRREYSNGLLTPEGELDVAGAWSVDTDNGVVYSYTRSNASTPTVFSFSYIPKIELNSSQWDFVNTTDQAQTIVIKEDAWVTKTRNMEATTYLPGFNIIGLQDFSVIKGSVRFNVPDDIKGTELDPFIEEVEFTNSDLHPELTNVIQTVQIIPELDPGTGNIASFTLGGALSQDSDLSVSFSEPTIFITEKSDQISLTSTGDWFVERTPGSDFGKVFVHTGGTSITSPGEVAYYIMNTSQVKAGAYSINYKRGEIFTQRAIPEGCTVTYQYSDYRIAYDISRDIPKEDWVFDPSTKTITLLDREIQRRSDIAQAFNSGALNQATYQVSYNHITRVRQDITELTSYFSPVLKDYTLQVVSKEEL